MVRYLREVRLESSTIKQVILDIIDKAPTFVTNNRVHDDLVPEHDLGMEA